MNYNFKNIPNIPQASELIDIVLSKTQRKTPTEVHPQFKISRILRFYMRKVKFTQSTIEDKINEILQHFPKLDDIHPFYADLMNVLYDRDHYKIALGHLNKAKSLVEHVSNDYVRMLKYADSLYRAKTLKKAALGRMCTILKKLKNSLNYLEEVRKHLGRLPSIDPHTRSILLTGYPNVGKSSFMNLVTRADVDVQPYAFTTKSLFVGHTDYDFLPWQVIDSPGLLDRSLEERNTIEMQAITALAHLNVCVLFLIDISETCGYTIAQQVQLFENIKTLFQNKPVGLVLTKCDLVSPEQLSPEYQQELQRLSQSCAFTVNLSNLSKDGVIDCRNRACEALREFRQQYKTKKGVAYQHFEPFVAHPKQRDNKQRPARIPGTVIEKLSGAPEPERQSIKEVQEMNGGPGVFYIPVQEHFVDLEDEEWKYDVMPEIIDGKNVFDFIDPDIMNRLDQLEMEEEIQKDAHEPFDYDYFRTLHNAKRNIFLSRKHVQQENALKKGRFNPKKINVDDLEQGLDEIGMDGQAVRGRAIARKRGRSDPGEEIDMDIDEAEDMGSVLRKKLKAKKGSINRSRSKGAKKVDRGKDEYAWLPKNRANIADTHIPTTKPRHLLSGKRGIGKNERR